MCGLQCRQLWWLGLLHAEANRPGQTIPAAAACSALSNLLGWLFLPSANSGGHAWPRRRPLQESHLFLLDACVLIKNIKYNYGKKMENRYVIHFPLKYVSTMPLSTQWFRVPVERNSELFLSSHLISSVTVSAHWQGGRWEVMMQLVSGIGPLGNPYLILHCVPKWAADTQGLLFFFSNCLENFMLFFWLLAMNEHTSAQCMRKNSGASAAWRFEFPCISRKHPAMLYLEGS